MDLRKTTLVITGIVSAVIMLGVYSVLYGAMYQNVAALEQNNVMNLINDANTRLSSEAVQLGRTLGDWASWDDTYRFIEDRNDAYVKSNLEDASLAAAHIHIIGYYGLDGRTVLVKMVSSGNALADPVPDELLALPPGSRILKHENGSVQGIMVLGGRLAAVASRPILTSKGEGPSRGTILMARYISKEDIASIAGARGITTSMWQMGGMAPADYQSAADIIFASENSTLIRPISDTVVAGYFVARDIYNRPVAIFRVESLRNDFAEFRKNALYMFAMILVAAVVFGTLNFVLLDRFMLSRLRRLGEQAEQIGMPNGNVEGIVPDGGRDEITRLALDINRMLARLKSTQHELLQNQVGYGLRLNEEVKRKTRQLAEANARLRSMERSKNQFLFNIGHELKSPLSVIEMNLAAVKGRGVKKEQLEESNRMIARNLERLKQEIEEIIQLSRFEYGKDVQKEELEFVALVREVVGDYYDFASIKGAKIHLDGFGQRLMVMGDRRLLRYALGNLFSNAVKYCDEKDINVRIERKGRAVEFSIANRGEGIKPENRRKLFKKFFKEDPNAPGTGVGLFITREIARGHSGDVWYEPNRPRGAIFHFSIPAMRGGVLDEKK